MVTPTDLDVVFYSSSCSSTYSESTGNRIYRELLEKHYKDYYKPQQSQICNRSHTIDNEPGKHQKSIRQQLLKLFQEKTSAFSAAGHKAEFYNHLEKGDCVSYSRVCFRKNIDKKIKESFERMRLERGDEFERDENDPGNQMESVSVTSSSLRKESSVATTPTSRKSPASGGSPGSSSEIKSRNQQTTLITMARTTPDPSNANNLSPEIGVAPTQNTPTSSLRSPNTWGKHEHTHFMRAIRRYGTSDWEKVASFIATRTPEETKSYASQSLNVSWHRSYAKHWESISEYMDFLNCMPIAWTQNPSWNMEDSIEAIQEQCKRSPGSTSDNSTSWVASARALLPWVGKKRRTSARTSEVEDAWATESPPRKKLKDTIRTDTHETSAPVNKSNWGKLQNLLFRGKEVSHRDNPLSTASSDGRSDRGTHSLNRPRSVSGLKPMDEIISSPYEGNRSAETHEELLEELKMQLLPTKHGLNPILEKHFGLHLATTMIQARLEILKSDVLYNDNWKVGKIGDSKLGWIPKRQLLLCLNEERIGLISKSTTVGTALTEHYENQEYGEIGTLQMVTKKLECFELVVWVLKAWNLKFEYPELYSNKGEREFIFKFTSLEDRISCYKCLIFVARVVATLILLKKERHEEVSLSLVNKVKKCLSIMNTHVEAYPSVFQKLMKRKRKREEGSHTSSASRSIRSEQSKRRKKSSSFKVSNSQNTNNNIFGVGIDAIFPIDNARPTSSLVAGTFQQQQFRQKWSITGTCEEREATLLVTCGILKKLTTRYTNLIGYIQKKLPEGLDEMKSEMRDNLQLEASSSKKSIGRRRR